MVGKVVEYQTFPIKIERSDVMVNMKAEHDLSIIAIENLIEIKDQSRTFFLKEHWHTVKIIHPNLCLVHHFVIRCTPNLDG